MSMESDSQGRLRTMGCRQTEKPEAVVSGTAVRGFARLSFCFPFFFPSFSSRTHWLAGLTDSPRSLAPAFSISLPPLFESPSPLHTATTRVPPPLRLDLPPPAFPPPHPRPRPYVRLPHGLWDSVLATSLDNAEGGGERNAGA
jgi:hypothetical protein